MIKKLEPSSHDFPLSGAPFMDFYLSLPQDFELGAIVDEALDVLKENEIAGIIVGKKKISRIYIRKYGITNLCNMNLRRNWRLTYTPIGLDKGKHSQFEKLKKLTCAFEHPSPLILEEIEGGVLE